MSETIVHNTGAPAAGERKSFFVREHHPENGSLLGFWLYLMSDCLIFACLFATYAVENGRRMMCLSLFWHFLDVIWIGVFTFVYLMGVLP